MKKLFTKREVRTASFELDGEEYDFYDALTRYVEDQSIKAAADDTARGRALGFTMAMLQRRFASSVYAVRRSLERMRDKRQKILADPEEYRQEQIEDQLPDDFDDLPEDEQLEIEAKLEGVVASVDPTALREEIQQLGKLIDHARALEGREIESKLVKLRKVLSDKNVFNDPKMKLLIFTEHKDTLDYLAGDGKDGRPLGKLREWGLTITQIHGGMKIGDRDYTGHPHLRRARVPRGCPGSGRHRGRRRRHQPSVLLADDQLRHPLEPGAPGAAHGPHPPLRPGARLPHFQLRRPQHARRPRAREAPRTAPRDSQRAGHRPGLRRRRRGLSREPAGKAVPRHVRAPNGPEQHRGAHRPRRRPRTFPQDHHLDAGGPGEARAEPRCDRRQVGGGPRAAPGPRGDRGFLHCRRPDRRRPPQTSSEGRPRLPHREGAAHASADRRTARAALRPTWPRISEGRLRQGTPSDGPDAGVGHARPSAVRGRARRRCRARPR